MTSIKMMPKQHRSHEFRFRSDSAAAESSEIVPPPAAKTSAGPWPLSEEQRKAVSFLCLKTRTALYEGTRAKLGLYGGAGTGKTATVGHSDGLLQSLLPLNVGLCTTTHIAAGVMRESLAAYGQNREVITLASALGLRERRRGSEIHFEPACGKGCFSDFRVWLIDESSMISDELMGFIEEQHQPGQVLIFIGDVAQLPPVDKDSKVFVPSPAMELNPSNCVRLEEVHRFGGVLLERATEIRTQADAYCTPWRGAKDDSGEITALPVFKLGPAFEQRLKIDPQGDFRMLAYTNAQVDYWNNRAHRCVYGASADPFHLGQQLISREGIKRKGYNWRDSENAQLAWGASAVIQISHAPEFEEEWFEDVRDSRGMVMFFPSWKLQAFSDRTERTETFRVLDFEGRANYREALKNLAAQAKKDGGDSWGLYWKVRDSFADVQYGWASTVHRAQGCGFDTVFLDLKDLHKPRCEEFKRTLIYTAATRARRAVICESSLEQI